MVVTSEERGGTMVGMAEPPTYTAEQIKALRQEKLKLSQAEAAKRIGVSQNLWSAWERGERAPDTSRRILLRLLEEGKI